MRNRQIKKNPVMLIALMGALLVSISLSVRAGEGDGKTVSVRDFSQLKAALEDPDTETVCLEPNTIGLEYSESLVTSRAGDHGITVNGTKILDIGKGGHLFYFKESEADKNGFDAFFYVGSHASLTITGEGGLEYSPAYRTDKAENSMFMIGTGGKVNISDEFKGMLAVTAGKNKKTDVCSLFTLEKYAILTIGKCNEAHFYTRPNPQAMAASDRKSGMIYDPSDSITYITVLGGVFHPADGQYLLYNTYRNSPSPDIFFNNVMLAEKVSDADDARIFNNSGSVPAYSVYIMDGFEKYVALNTIPFKNQNYEPSVIYLQPDENSELSVRTNNSLYLRGLDIYVRNIGDEQYPAAPVYSENGGKENFIWNGLSGTSDSSKRVLKLVFRYSYEGYEWTNEREIYVITSKAGTEQEPEIVYNYDGLRRALADPIVRYISTNGTCNAILEAADPGLVKNAVDRYRATGYITELDDTIKEFEYCKTENVDVLKFLGYGLSNSALTTVGAKHLELKENMSLTAGVVTGAVNHDWQEEGVLYGIDLYNSDLSISGTGKIIWQGNSKADKALSAAVHVGYNSSLVLEGAGITAGRNLNDANLNKNGYAAAVYAAGEGSSVTVKQGVYSGGVYGVKGDDNMPAEYPKSFEGAAILAGKNATVSIIDGTFTDTYLGEVQVNGAYPGTDYARGSAGLGILIDKTTSAVLPASVKIRNGEFPTGIRKCRLSGTSSFSFLGQDQAYIKANLLYDLAQFAEVTTDIKETGSGVSITGARITAPATVGVITLDDTYKAPKEGIDAVVTALINSSAGWAVDDDDVYWNVKDAAGNVESTISKVNPGVFAAGKYYELILPVTAANYHVFELDGKGDPKVTATLGGKPMTVRKSGGNDPSLKLELVYDFGKCNSTVITELGVKLIQEAVHGSVPSKSAIPAGTGYQIEEVMWHVRNGSSWDGVVTDETFEYGREYKASFRMSPEDGYSFKYIDFDPAVTFSFNGGTPRLFDNNIDIQGYQRVTFCDIPVVVNKKTVNEIKLGNLTAPAPGKQPDFSADSLGSIFYTIDASYGNSGIKWSDSTGRELGPTSRFIPGETYTATISVIPAKNTAGNNVSEFDTAAIADGTLKTYVNGMEAQFDQGSSGADKVLVKKSWTCGHRSGSPVSEVSAQITAPVLNSTPTLSAELPAGAAYYVSAVSWYGRINGSDKQLDSNDEFEKGGSYEARISLLPKDGYYFNLDDLGFLTVNGTINGDSAKVEGDADQITLSATMSIPKEKVETPIITAVFDEEEKSYAVSFACNTPGADVYYTIDGSAPDNNSTKYIWGQPLTLKNAAAVNGLIKLRCIASADTEQYYDSDEADELLDFGTEYRIYFNAGAGSGNMDFVYTINGGKFILPICSFTPPAGMIFDIWELGKDSGNYAAPAEYATTGSEIVVYAKWKAKPAGDKEYCNVYFSGNFGEGTMEAVTVEKGSSVKLPECGYTAPEGMTFFKWKLGNTELYADAGYEITVTEDIIMMAIWKEKDLEIPADAIIAPTATEKLVYNGTAQKLVNPGEVKENLGTMYYAVTAGSETETVPDNEFFDVSIPEASDAGSYAVWYKVRGDKEHKDIPAKFIYVTIEKASPLLAGAPADGSTVIREYMGEEITLLDPATITDTTCKILYSTDGSSWTETALKAKDRGDYIVYYKVEGNENYNDVVARKVNVKIALGEKDKTVHVEGVSFELILKAPASVSYNGKKHVQTGTPLSKKKLKTMCADLDFKVLGIPEYASAKISYKKNINALGGAYYTAKLVIDKKSVAYKKLSKDDRKKAAGEIAKVNRELKKKAYRVEITILQRDLTSYKQDMNETTNKLIVFKDAEGNAVRVALKTGKKKTGISSVRSYYSDKKTITESKKQISREVTKTAEGTITVRLTGYKNYKGTLEGTAKQ